jgi:WD40 repeat protein
VRKGGSSKGGAEDLSRFKAGGAAGGGGGVPTVAKRTLQAHSTEVRSEACSGSRRRLIHTLKHPSSIHVSFYHDIFVSPYLFITVPFYHRIFVHRITVSLYLHTSLQVNSVAFDEGGETVVTGSSDNTVKVWDSVSGRLKCALRGTCIALLL